MSDHRRLHPTTVGELEFTSRLYRHRLDRFMATTSEQVCDAAADALAEMDHYLGVDRLAKIAHLEHVAQLAARYVTDAVIDARAKGATWDHVADALGAPRAQIAERRYGHVA